ncbi:MAG: flavin reductase family protein [Candidatus Omnitrophota bacterium]|nr:MAG: flavin reductase family protein [Candidatus Omnitrophota bacterium]
MKVNIPKVEASRLLNCGMVVLVTAAYKDKTTITPCAWQMPLSKKPACLGIALAKAHFSSELIRKSEEFIINIPHWDLLDKVVFCGSHSGRDIDKFAESRLTLIKPLSLSKTPQIGECLGHLECTLLDIKEVGDHYLFLGEVICAQADDNYFVNKCWDTRNGSLIFHLGGRSFFKSSPFVEVGR